MGQPCWAQIRDFQTSRLASTAGTGVASVLSTEAAILNPATAAFFDGSSASYQRVSTALKHKSADRGTTDDYPSKNVSQGYFMSDHSGPVKGGVAYIDQNENNYSRQRMVLHGATPMGTSASVGVSYKYTRDKFPSKLDKQRSTFHQLTFGNTYIIDENTILGLIIVDPLRSNKGDERMIGGFQYNITHKITVLGDIGYQYSRAYNKQYLWSVAAQINIFSDFYFRAGKFYDNIQEYKGTGWGASWIGPRFGVEFAQKYSDQFGSNSYLYKNESVVDTSISALIKF